MEKVNIIIADDHFIFRLGLKRLVGRIPFVGNITEAEDGTQVINCLETGNHDIVLLDIHMPKLDGIDTLAIIRQRFPAVKVIILSMFCNEDQIEVLYEYKMDGYLNKAVSYPELSLALKNVIEGGHYFCKEVGNVLFRTLPLKNEMSKKNANISFTEREKEILQLICEQFSSEDIASKLNISTRTVARIRENLIDKACVRNTAGLVLYAIKNAIVKVN